MLSAKKMLGAAHLSAGLSANPASGLTPLAKSSFRLTSRPSVPTNAVSMQTWSSRRAGAKIPSVQPLRCKLSREANSQRHGVGLPSDAGVVKYT